MVGEGKEGDWACSGCGNRNYAFRSFCNRCKQARLLVDTKTPADSKWLPRIGDWICACCTNNNYASREKCKKCGQPKEIAAMPAIAMPGVSLPTEAHYFARVQGAPDQNVNIGFLGNGGLQQSLPLRSTWSLVGADRYGIHPADKFGVQPVSTWPLGGTNSSVVPLANQIITAPKGWRSGDWICNCGFHNYSSRTQCKKCNASMPPAAPSSLVGTGVTVLGTKRLASEELAQDWDSKRLNAGQVLEHFPTLGLQQTYPAFDLLAGASSNQKTNVYYSYPSAGSTVASNLQFDMQLPHLVNIPALPGKGAKQWRNGDWMCTNCNNHNYSSRVQCNRCKTPREVHAQPAGIA